MRLLITLLFFAVATAAWSAIPGFGREDSFAKGELLYRADFSGQDEVSDWIMEGPGVVRFDGEWMEMFSPGERMHHVFWCPRDFPASFIAEWEVQNLHAEAGLLIVFFAAQGEAGEDIFDPDLPQRDGTFDQYTLGKIRSYHISYYTNAAHNPDRGHANLRKNNTFTLLQQGSEGIPAASTAIHRVRLIKDGARILLFVDGRKVVDYRDNEDYGPPLQAGKIGFRQMQWTHFQYRNFEVWSLADPSVNGLQ